MKIYRSIAELQEYLFEQRKQGLSVGLVATLGCLHIGHQALFETARKACDIVVGTVFVNPLQFRQEKYEAYPQDLDNDTKLAEKVRVDALFLPPVKEVYPTINSYTELFEWQDLPHARDDNVFVKEDIHNSMLLRVPLRLTDKMDGGLHAWHYDGVATIVYRLFQIILPSQAYFGEKDPQQLAIIEQMVEQYKLKVLINRVPTVRENSGLAYSSRNTQLSPSQRDLALQVHNIFAQALARLNNAENDPDAIVGSLKSELASLAGLDVEYLGLVDKNTLSAVTVIKDPIILYLAYIIDGIRLTDTLEFTPAEEAS